MSVIKLSKRDSLYQGALRYLRNNIWLNHKDAQDHIDHIFKTIVDPLLSENDELKLKLASCESHLINEEIKWAAKTYSQEANDYITELLKERDQLTEANKVLTKAHIVLLENAYKTVHGQCCTWFHHPDCKAIYKAIKQLKEAGK